MKVRGALSFILFAAFATSYIIGQDAPKQETARTVHYHAQDIVPIHAKLNFTTLLVLPTSEEVIDAAVGDKEFWIVEPVQNFVFLHPAKEHIESNLNLITNKGNVYSFTLSDVSGTATPVDLKVIIQTTDLSSIIPMSTQERFVPAAVSYTHLRGVRWQAICNVVIEYSRLSTNLCYCSGSSVSYSAGRSLLPS